MATTSEKPVVALTLGDPAGIGSELIAKLLARRDVLDHAKVVLVGDRWLWEEGQAIAGLQVATRAIGSFDQVRSISCTSPLFLPVESVRAGEVLRSRVSAAGGASVLKVLKLCLDAASAGPIDAICFAPLNKQSMKMAGLQFADELHFFADQLKVTSYLCEFNTLGNLWTSRITSHVPFKDIAGYLSKERILDAVKLLHDALRSAGFEYPRVAVAALNPHGGEGGAYGREEIDIIAPAVRDAQAQGFAIAGPFPADTIFLKARDGQYDGIVTMYHDQGQIALKLLGFDRGVTIQGGLPIPITTPAHGTAFDIAGQNKANVEATVQAFLIASRMGASRRSRVSAV
ncbi:MAG TPA: 4-hydroxythreonine-4-phosphate dehydrogenase PdxA [Acidobacteriaceae bacterium]|nr:4-hydroxythreonine-4-phosphate dehydrogenase PdxA [Acidobacteriaceae bacterium]